MSPAGDEFADAIPEVDNEPRSRKEKFDEEDAAMAKLSILDVYTGLGGAKPERSGGTDEVLVFCPSAGHNNTNTEAACINVKKNTWVCYGECDDGGGIVDLMAAHMGLPFGKNLKNIEYAKAKEELLVQFAGWERVKDGKFSVAKSPAQLEREEKEFQERHSEPVKLEVVKPLKSTGEDSTSTGIEEYSDDVRLPEIADIWDHLPKGTPLYEYMVANSTTSVPAEFDLFNAFGLLGLSVGPFIRGKIGRLFKPSLSVLRISGSGTGKSQSEAPLREALRFPLFAWLCAAPNPGEVYATQHGIKNIVNPGSGEYLLKQLSTDFVDGTEYKIRDVMGWLSVDEFRAFMGKGNIKGSSLFSVYLELDNRSGLEDFVETGSMGTGKIKAYNACLFFTTTIQPNAFRDLVGQTNIDNGLLARFETVTGNPIIGIAPWDDAPKSMEKTFEAYNDVFAFYEKIRAPQGAFERREIHEVQLSESAKPFYNECYIKMQKLKASDDIRSRFDLKLAKYSLLFALNSQHEEILEEDVRHAMWVMEYLTRTTRMTSEKASENTEIVIDKEVLKAVRYHYAHKAGYATEGVVYHHVNAPKNGWQKTLITKSLETLVRAGDIEARESNAARGRKTTRYYALPAEDWNEPQSPKAVKESKK